MYKALKRGVIQKADGDGMMHVEGKDKLNMKKQSKQETTTKHKRNLKRDFKNSGNTPN